MQRARDWLKEGQAELAAARDLLAGGHWSWCCFTSQQAAEKALNAICEHDQDPQSGHNLNPLLSSVAQRHPVPLPVRSASAQLNRYYIPARYPDAFPQGAPAEQYFESDGRAAYAQAEEVYRFAEGI